MGNKSGYSRKTRIRTASRLATFDQDPGRAVAAAALGWFVPGAGHILVGRTQKGVIFLLGLPMMFAIGLALEGRLFPFDPGQPLVLLAAFADLGNGLPYFLAHLMGLGEGRVVADSFEYGNTFTIVSGLLNMLVCLDAHDVALGRR